MTELSQEDDTVADSYRNLSFPDEGLSITPIAAYLYVPPITWKGDPVGHIGVNDCFFFLVSGECYIKIEDKSFVLRAGQLAFLPRGKMRTYTTMSSDFTMYEIAFDFRIGNKYWCDELGLGDGYFCVDVADQTAMSRLFEASVRHEYNKSIIYDIICFSNIAQIIRVYAEARFEAETKTHQFAEVIKYMEAVTDSQIRVEELAHIACMQTTYFIKKFKAAFGMSPISYLNKLKIYRSMTLLLSTGLSVEGVARSVGIYDSSYFSKMFKRFCLISPNEYRKLFSRG